MMDESNLLGAPTAGIKTAQAGWLEVQHFTRPNQLFPRRVVATILHLQTSSNDP